MQKSAIVLACFFLACFSPYPSTDQHIPEISIETLPFQWYPAVNPEEPNLPSPFRSADGEEFLVALTKDSTWAIVPVTMRPDREICQQLVMDTSDFPVLVTTGLHDQAQLMKLQTITGRPVAEITQLALPGGLSTDGFLASDENIVSVLRGDDEFVRKMRLTHPQLAKCVFHAFNLMDEDLKLNRWNMAHHEWEHMLGFYYNNGFVQVQAFDTKGGQRSVFDDGITGAFHLKVRRPLTMKEQGYLDLHYPQLSPEDRLLLEERLSFFNTGEMEPQYIMRYGFYEGHTGWRTDPIAIAFIFGLRTLEELDRIFEGNLYEVLTQHFIE